MPRLKTILAAAVFTAPLLAQVPAAMAGVYTHKPIDHAEHIMSVHGTANAPASAASGPNQMGDGQGA